MNIKVLETNKNPFKLRPVTFADLEVGDMFLIECDIYIKLETHTTEDGYTFNAVNLIYGSRANFSDKQNVGFFNGIFTTPIEDMLFYIDVNKKLADYRKY